jgi:alpha-galactosidase
MSTSPVSKTVLIGAGSAVFTRYLVSDLMQAGWDGELVLVDIDSAALAVARGVVSKMLAAGRSRLRLSATTDHRAALPGAGMVIATIGVGGRRAWEQDVFIPRRHGIHQPVGDTTMPGGISRALRMIPAMVAIARDVRELAPTALFINYSNPMSAICRAVEKATGAGMVGLCHGVPHSAHLLAEAIGAKDAQVEYTALGINHLTWFTSLRCDGTERMPEVLARARAGEVVCGWPFSSGLAALLGAFPVPGDRHVCEFFPAMHLGAGAYLGQTLGIDAFPFEATIARGDKVFSDMAALAASDAPVGEDYIRCQGGEEVVPLATCLAGGGNRVFSVNLPNRGQIPNLPPEVVVEAPALATRGGLRPLANPPLPPAVAAILVGRFNVIEVTVEAALRGDRDLVVQALLLDGSVTSLAQARRLGDDLLAAQAAHLPQFARPRACAEG